MHPNPRFAWTDKDAMLAFIADIAFSTIFVATPGGGHLLHIPVVVHDARRLRFHVARANRAASALDGAAVLLSCTGPEAYVSPDWYGTPDQVPTWNYIAVECQGMLRRLNDDELAEQIDALSAAHEARLAPKTPWTRHKMSDGRFEAMAKAIVGYELAIEDLRGTRKRGQNKTADERAGAVAALAATGRADIADLMAREA